MKIIALSDTHLIGPAPARLLAVLKDADVVLHAGDFNTLEAYESLKGACKELIAVRGNCDAPELQELLPESRTFELEGVKFGLVHSGKNVTDITNMRYLALEMGVGVLVFGHLHRPIVDRSDVLLVCPGSPTHPRMSDPAVIELKIEQGGVVSGNIVNVSTGSPCGYIQFARSL
ncbi:MAG TPA: metallophosphoesterase [Methanocella sp.]|nr:metallophosphoesterase [Methanocella sp.]